MVTEWAGLSGSSGFCFAVTQRARNVAKCVPKHWYRMDTDPLDSTKFFFSFLKWTCQINPSLQVKINHSFFPCLTPAFLSFYPEWRCPDPLPSCSLCYFSLKGLNMDTAQSLGEAPPAPRAEPCKSHREAHDAQWNEKPNDRHFLYLTFPHSAPAASVPWCPLSPFLLSILALAPSLPPTPPSHQQFGRASPKQASGTLHFQSLKEARAQRSLLYHKLEHEKLIHFIHLSGGGGGQKKIFAARFLIANLSHWREAAEIEVFTDR